MPTFESSDELYKVLGGFLAELVENPDLRPKLKSANIALLVTYTEPEAQMLLDTRCDPPAVTMNVPADAAYDVGLLMSADDGHWFWLGSLNMPLALAKRQLRMSGSMGVVMKLLPSMQPAFKLYKEYLAENGYGHLAE